MTDVARAVWRTRRFARALCLGVVGMLLAVALLSGTLQAGARYFYCEGLGLSASDPCAAAARHADDRCPLRGIERKSPDCCSMIQLPSMPDGTRVDGHSVPPAGITKVLSASQYTLETTGIGRETSVSRTERWRIPPRPSGELRAQLM